MVGGAAGAVGAAAGDEVLDAEVVWRAEGDAGGARGDIPGNGLDGGRGAGPELREEEAVAEGGGGGRVGSDEGDSAFVVEAAGGGIDFGGEPPGDGFGTCGGAALVDSGLGGGENEVDGEDGVLDGLAGEGVGGGLGDADAVGGLAHPVGDSAGKEFVIEGLGAASGLPGGGGAVGEGDGGIGAEGDVGPVGEFGDSRGPPGGSEGGRKVLGDNLGGDDVVVGADDGDGLDESAGGIGGAGGVFDGVLIGAVAGGGFVDEADAGDDEVVAGGGLDFFGGAGDVEGAYGEGPGAGGAEAGAGGVVEPDDGVGPPGEDGVDGFGTGDVEFFVHGKGGGRDIDGGAGYFGGAGEDVVELAVGGQEVARGVAAEDDAGLVAVSGGAFGPGLLVHAEGEPVPSAEEDDFDGLGGAGAVADDLFAAAAEDGGGAALDGIGLAVGEPGGVSEVAIDHEAGFVGGTVAEGDAEGGATEFFEGLAIDFPGSGHGASFYLRWASWDRIWSISPSILSSWVTRRPRSGMTAPRLRRVSMSWVTTWASSSPAAIRRPASAMADWARRWVSMPGSPP